MQMTFFNDMEKAKPTLVLVDGSNFFFKSSLNHTIPPDSWRLSMFASNLCKLMKTFNPCEIVICWDGGYKERFKLSEEAVKAGIIPRSYKQDRRDKHVLEPPADWEQIKHQMNLVREMLSYTKIRQALVPGEEADDVAGTLCIRNNGTRKVVLVTTDKDYYQLLWHNVEVYNSSIDHHFYKANLKYEYGLNSPEEWVEACVLAGDTGDTIFGVHGIGIKTACKLIQQYGSVEAIIKFAWEKFSNEIKKHGYEAFAKKVLSGKFTCKKHMNEAKVLASKNILELGFKLKRIHTNLNFELEEAKPDWRKLEEFLMNHKISLKQEFKEHLLMK